MHNASSFSYVLERVASIRMQKYKKSVMLHSIITDFIMSYSLIPRFCFFVGIPNASMNSFFFRLNQLMCETPSILRSNLSSAFCLREQTALSTLKCWLNSREYSSPLMETSLNVQSFLMTASPKFKVSRRNFIVGISFSTYGK